MDEQVPIHKRPKRPAEGEELIESWTWWELSAWHWPTFGAGCHSDDRAIELTFRMLDRPNND